CSGVWRPAGKRLWLTPGGAATAGSWASGRPGEWEKGPGRAPRQRRGLGQRVGGVQQLRQVVEADGDGGVVRAVALLRDGQGAAVERLGPTPTGGVPPQRRQGVEGLGDVGGIRAIGTLAGGQGAAGGRPRPPPAGCG